MNALRIILLVILVIYLTFVHPKFLLHFFALFIPYIVITQYLFFNSPLNTVKTKVFISSWANAYDPQIYGTSKMKSTKVKNFCEEYSKQKGVKVGLTTFLLKMTGKMLKKFTDVNGNIIFGRYIPKENADVCCLVATEKGEESDILTIRNADKLSLEEISKKVEEKKRNIENKTDADYNRRLLIAQFMPTFLLSPIVRISSYISSCGVDLSFIGFPKFTYGSIIVCPMHKLGLEHAYLPLPPYTQSSVLMNVCKPQTKFEMINGDLQEERYVNLNFTIDHRYLDGALAAKIQREIEFYFDNPEKVVEV